MDEITVTFDGPDEDGNVWAYSDTAGEKQSTNLGKLEDVMEAMSQFLGSQDYQERG